MEKYILFLSHSSNDYKVINSFVDFMYKIGLTENDMICSSSPYVKIPVTENIYDYLNDHISNEHIYAIYFLSDNYYSSPVCLNEMGAIWLKKAKSLNILLPEFDYKDIQGVVSKDSVGIKLGTSTGEIISAFNEFKSILIDLFKLEIPNTRWELARDEFLSSTIEKIREFNMTFSRSYCIGDQENDGCKIIKKESNRNLLKAFIDFNETDSKLSDIVCFCTNRNFTSYFINNKNICFEAYADSGITHMDVEVRLEHGLDRPYEVSLDEDEKSYRIPLIQFCDSLPYWKDVSEVKFVIHRKRTSDKGYITIKNLRIE